MSDLHLLSRVLATYSLTCVVCSMYIMCCWSTHSGTGSRDRPNHTFPKIFLQMVTEMPPSMHAAYHASHTTLTVPTIDQYREPTRALMNHPLITQPSTPYFLLPNKKHIRLSTGHVYFALQIAFHPPSPGIYACIAPNALLPCCESTPQRKKKRKKNRVANLNAAESRVPLCPWLEDAPVQSWRKLERAYSVVPSTPSLFFFFVQVPNRLICFETTILFLFFFCVGEVWGGGALLPPTKNPFPLETSRLQYVAQFLERHGLAQKQVDAAAKRLLLRLGRGEARERDDQGGRLLVLPLVRADQPRGLEPVHDRHADI